MRKLSKSFLKALILCLLLGQMVHPSMLASAGVNIWTSIGPYGGDITALVIDPMNPDIIYAGTADGFIFKSLNGGKSWISLTSLHILSIAIDPFDSRTLYAGDAYTIKKSTDAGVTWQSIDGSPFLSQAIVMDPFTPGTLYSAGKRNEDGYGVFRSVDAGVTWVPLNNGLPGMNVRTLALDTHNPGILYAGNSGYLSHGLYKTTTGGSSWIALNSVIDVHTVVIDPSDSNILYIGLYQFGMIKSTNGGTNWTSVDTGRTLWQTVNSLAVDPQDTETIYAGTDTGMIKVNGGGSTWDWINTGLSNNMIQTVVIDPQHHNTVYTGTHVGVYKSINSGGEWVHSSYGMNIIRLDELAADPVNSGTLYSVSPYGIYRTTNSGLNWNLVNNGLYPLMEWTYLLQPIAPWTIAFDPVDPNIQYIGAGEEGLYKSTDAGETWSRIAGVLLISKIAFDPVDHNVLYAGTHRYGLWKSIDGGENWIGENSGFHSEYRVTDVEVDPLDPNTVYLGTIDGLYKSLDGGEHWDLANDGAEGSVVALEVDYINSSTVYSVVAESIYSDYVFYNSKVYKSVDGGEHWSLMNSGLPVDPRFTSLVMDPVDPKVLYAGSNYAGVYKTTDGGENWFAINTGLDEYFDVHDLAIGPGPNPTLYIGTNYRGAYSIQSLPIDLSLNHSSGSSGSFFTVTGTNFPSDQEASIKVNGNNLGTIAIDSSGGFSFQLDSSQASEGDYQVTVSVLDVHRTVRFLLADGEPVQPADGSGPMFVLPAGIGWQYISLPLVSR
jgi:photosystem II stability/assembly factor-like uncharacterized protein